MPTLRHPSLGFRVPDPIARLIRWVGTDRKREDRAVSALGIGYLAPWVRDLAGRLTTKPAKDPHELGYAHYPFEVIPVLQQGGDGLAFCLLIHDDLPNVEPPMVSYAPSDSDGPRWLGDDAAAGLANVLGVSVRDAGRTPAWAYASRSEVAEVRKDVQADAKVLAGVLGVRVPRVVRGLSEGARSNRPAKLPIPRGYRFEKTRDGVGVLAPSATFDPQLRDRKEPGPRGTARSVLKLASDLLARGFPASSLVVARDLYREALSKDSIAPALAMKAAYLALGRKFLARRVDIYVDYHRR